MSQENVELVRRLSFGPELDIVPLIRDEQMAMTALRGLARFLHPEFECVLLPASAMTANYPGSDGLRAGLLEWLAPWASYRTAVEELIDAGDAVLALERDRGRLHASDREVELIGATLWRFRDGKVVNISLYASRAAALKAVGLQE